MERVLDDSPDHLRRETRELLEERRGDGVEVGALVILEAARRAHFSYVRVVRFCGEGGAGAEEDRDEADMLAVERMRRPAAALGPNWLALMTGRAQEDGVAGW